MVRERARSAAGRLSALARAAQIALHRPVRDRRRPVAAQIVSALRRVLPAEASTPALLLPLWLRGDRLAGVSAMWELCVASVHARRDLGALQRLFTDACAQGHNPLRAAPSLAALRDAMQLQRLKS
jgi:hypothetical protein